MPLVQALERQRQEDSVSSWLSWSIYQVQNSQDYIEVPCLKRKKGGAGRLRMGLLGTWRDPVSKKKTGNKRGKKHFHSRWEMNLVGVG